MPSSMPTLKWTTIFILTLVNMLMEVVYANPRPQLVQPQQPQMMFEHSEPVQQNHKCREWEWMCEDGIECIAQYDVCDGVSQCSDQSDERNCMNRYPAEGFHRPTNQINQQRPPDHQPPQPHNEPAKPSSSSTSTAPPHNKHENAEEAGELNMKYIFGGLSIFVFVAFVTHALLKRRKRRLGTGGQLNRFRKGDSLVDDEDDLLISQMYN